LFFFLLLFFTVEKKENQTRTRMNMPHRNLILRPFDYDKSNDLNPGRYVYDIHRAKESTDLVFGWFYHNGTHSLVSDVRDHRAEWRHFVPPEGCVIPKKMLLGILWRDKWGGHYLTSPEDSFDPREAVSTQADTDAFERFVHRAQSVDGKDTNKSRRDEVTSALGQKHCLVIKRQSGSAAPVMNLDRWRYFVYLESFLTVAVFQAGGNVLHWKCPECKRPVALSLHKLGRLPERISGTSLSTSRLAPLLVIGTACTPCKPIGIRIACQGMVPMMTEGEMFDLARAGNLRKIDTSPGEVEWVSNI
jgi:hypothetical protein